MHILHFIFAEERKSDWPDICVSFRYLDVFLYTVIVAFTFATENSWIVMRARASVKSFIRRRRIEGSRDERSVTKRNVATRLGQADGLGLIEIYSTLGNQELYILPHVRPLSHALLSRITPYWYQFARGNLYLAGDLVQSRALINDTQLSAVPPSFHPSYFRFYSVPRSHSEIRKN